LIDSKTASLDTLYGGLTPQRAGGGHQTKSLRLTDPDGKEYVMRAVKKSVGRFLQNVAFKNQYIANELEIPMQKVFFYDFILLHILCPLGVGNLADEIGVLHTNPRLYYIQKKKTLGSFNTDCNELYLVEERPSDSQTDLKTFGEPDDIITEDLLENLHKDEKHAVDEDEYIKARLFDMLIGDWDRHYDQWRWAEYKAQVIYRPIPRDRDQAVFDGALLSILMTIPTLRHMQSLRMILKI
jgi:hypothetical protein